MKFVVHATQTKHFEIPVEAQDEEEALAKVDKWIEDDFEDFQTHAEWQMEVGDHEGWGVQTGTTSPWHFCCVPTQSRPPLRALDEAEQEMYEEARQQQ